MVTMKKRKQINTANMSFFANFLHKQLIIDMYHHHCALANLAQERKFIFIYLFIYSWCLSSLLIPVGLYHDYLVLLVEETGVLGK